MDSLSIKSFMGDQIKVNESEVLEEFKRKQEEFNRTVAASPTLAAPYSCKEGATPAFFVRYERVRLLGIGPRRDRWSVCYVHTNLDDDIAPVGRKMVRVLEHFNTFPEASRVRDNYLREW